MAVKFQDQPTLWDRLSGRAFAPSSVPFHQAENLVDYNPHYLSAFFNLRNSSDDKIYGAFQNGTLQSFDPKKGHHFFLDNYYLELNQYEKRPYFIVNGDTDVLSRLQLSGAEWEALRGQEVAFYFYEPLFVRSREGSRCPALFHLDSDVYFPELIWLEDFLRHHDHSFKAKVYVCDYRIKEFLRHKKLHPALEIETWDLFLVTTLNQLRSYERKRDPQFHKVPYTFDSQVTKKFICPNYRYEGFRELVMGFIKGQSYSEDGIASFFHRHSEFSLRNDLPFAPTELEHWDIISSGIQKMQSQLPLTFDTANSKSLDVEGFSIPDADGASNLRQNALLYTHYNQAFLALVNESRFFTVCGEISEKTFFPIAYMRPFLLFGGPHMLKYLREMGFETFAEYWDESYDLIEDHKQRLEALLKLTHEILSKPLSELQAMLRDMEPKLRRNRRHLFLEYQQMMYRALVDSQRTKT